ncbi:MAG: family N-acetyltransferase [Flavisolibacter sp.]|jgi:GNAT superfamily N-acetyltransferase|nr:family N-acetyltransferase [Flavisolibacter sp.]
MEQPNIRKATREDLSTLLRFEQGVIAAERPFDPTLKTENTTYYDIVQMITAPHIQLVVAEKNQEVIGCGYARIETSRPYLQHTQYAYLGFMYVEPEHRGTGINGLIIETLRQWAVAKSIFEMRLEVYYENLSAIKAYEKTGFTRHMIEMRNDLKSAQ